MSYSTEGEIASIISEIVICIPRIEFLALSKVLHACIFHILALKGPLTIYDLAIFIKRQRFLHRKLYSVVNRRVRALEQLGYVEKAGVRKTLAGFTATLYQLTPRTYLALILSKTDLDKFIERAEVADIITVLGIFGGS